MRKKKSRSNKLHLRRSTPQATAIDPLSLWMVSLYLPWQPVRHQFTALETLTIVAPEDEDPWPLSSFADLIRAPNLKTLRCYKASEWDDKDDPPCEKYGPLSTSFYGYCELQLPSSCLSIPHLMLQQARFSLTGMETLLKACRALEHLHPTVHSRLNVAVETHNFEVGMLMGLLLPHRRSLKTLIVDIAEKAKSGLPNFVYDGLGSMVDFEVLETVRVNLDLNFKPEDVCTHLPASLRSLGFAWLDPSDLPCAMTGRQVQMLAQVETLASLRQERFPQLQKITLNKNYSQPKILSQPEMGSKIDAYFEGAGCARARLE